MNRPTTPRRPNGFTLLEVVLAMALLAGSVLTYMQLSADDSRRMNVATARINAEQIAMNEIARLAATNPWSAWRDTTYRTNDFGEAATQGRYRVRISRSIRCDGGAHIVDNTAAPPPTLGCEERRPSAEYRITVFFPSTIASTGTDSVMYAHNVAGVGQYLTTWSPAIQP